MHIFKSMKEKNDPNQPLLSSTFAICDLILCSVNLIFDHSRVILRKK